MQNFKIMAKFKNKLRQKENIFVTNTFHKENKYCLLYEWARYLGLLKRGRWLY